MKIERNLLRVAEWFDADDHTTVFVVEMFRNGKWVGLMLSGQPQVFPNRTDAETLIETMVTARLDVPEKNINRRLTCVARDDGGKGIVPKDKKHIPLN